MRKEAKKIITRPLFFTICSVLLIIGIGIPIQGQTAPNRTIGFQTPFDSYYLDSVADQLLDETFRIDIQTITATFDYYPDSATAGCHAVVEFTMRPGQSRPVIHMGPMVRNTIVADMIQLNGESLNPSDTNDVSIVSFDGTPQQALEFQRDLAPDTLHRLEMSYSLPTSALYPRFSSEVSDLYGRGNEECFPTINCPRELARHQLTFRVHGNTPYRFIGSGLVNQIKTFAPSDVQEWTLDTEREIASYTLMFVLMPEADTIMEQRTVNGVDVRLMAFNTNTAVEEAFDVLEECLPTFETDFGPFPMPRGLSIFLVTSGGGMEYYGGTISSLWALRHEIFHMYFGCSTVNKTYRDTWMDEAINKWYEFSVDPFYSAIDYYYQSNIVSGRSPIGIGFDYRAYNEGAQIMHAVSRALDGRDQMIAFLRYVHTNYSFVPFTTNDFLDFLIDYAGIDLRGEFFNWLYLSDAQVIPESASGTAGASYQSANYHLKPDLSPPGRLLKKISLRRVK